MSDTEDKIVPPAKVHGDAAEAGVSADVAKPGAGDHEATESDEIPKAKDSQQSQNVEAGMRS